VEDNPVPKLGTDLKTVARLMLIIALMLENNFKI